MLIDTARTDAQVATALHEAAHAMAYISIGRKFQYLSLDDAVLMPRQEPIDEWSKAVTSMAGPAAEGLMYCRGRHDDGHVVAYILDCHQDAVECAQMDPEEIEDSDYVAAGSSALAALPTSLSIVSGTWSDIEVIAESALSTPDRLGYADIVGLVSNKHGGFNPDLLARWSDAVGRSQASRGTR